MTVLAAACSTLLRADDPPATQSGGRAGALPIGPIAQAAPTAPPAAPPAAPAPAAPAVPGVTSPGASAP